MKDRENNTPLTTIQPEPHHGSSEVHEISSTPESVDSDMNSGDQALPLSFFTLGLKKALVNNLSSLGYEQMTPIQAESLPILLKGHDLIAQAKTGSGKTAAFGLALLNHLNIPHFAAQGLVLCPTRELAEQVAQAFRRLARMMPNVKIVNLSGGVPMKPQLDSLRHGAHIIVGTPGRVQKHLDKGSLLLNKLDTLVLDEADRMLDMGFLDAIKQIIAFCPQKRQTLLFSATYPPEIKQLATDLMRNPEHVVIEELETALDIEQIFYEAVSKNDKFSLLKLLLLHYKPSSTLIFCNTKEQTTQLSADLSLAGFSAVALHGDLEQFDRDLAMIRFSNQSCSILVATDVAARGLDIKALPAVINYELAFEYDVHIHRVGRTGRAGCKGLALSLTTSADAARLCIIEDQLGKPLNWGDAGSLKPINVVKQTNSTKQTNAEMVVPEMVTLALAAGRKDKIRPGDILGALTKEGGFPGSVIGKIDIAASYSYVAIHQSHADKVYQYLQQGRLKGRKIDVRKI